MSKLKKTERAQLKQKFGGHCACCGCVLGDKWHADHIENVDRKIEFCPKRGLKSSSEMNRPELDTIENMNPACASCNISKHSMSLDTWRKILEDTNRKLFAYVKNYRLAVAFGQIQETPKPIVFWFEKYQAQEASQ